MRAAYLILAFLAACFSSSNYEERNGPGPSPPSTLTKCVDAPAPATVPSIQVLSNGDPPIELVPNGKLGLHSGGQGGQHTFVWVRVFHDAAATTTADTEIRDGTGEVGFQGSAVMPKCAGKWSEARITTFRESYSTLENLTLKVSVIEGSGAPLVVELPVQVDN